MLKVLPFLLPRKWHFLLRWNMSLRKLHPLPLLLYFLAVFFLTVFANEYSIILPSLLASFLTNQLLRPRRPRLRTMLSFLGFFVLILFFNLLLNPEGTVVLFRIGTRNITLEALNNGIKFACLIFAVIFWFDSFNVLMTSEKLIYLSGRILPATSLVLTMGLKYLPVLQRQTVRSEHAQKAVGLSGERKLKNRLKILASLLSWSLEGAVDTAAAMKARGYGLGKRSHYTRFVFRGRDFFFSALVLLYIALVIFGQFWSGYYLEEIGLGLLFFTGLFCEAKEKIQWHYWKSKN
jgi:energy-coupling factor transport system permease protein